MDWIIFSSNLCKAIIFMQTILSSIRKQNFLDGFIFVLPEIEIEVFNDWICIYFDLSSSLEEYWGQYLPNFGSILTFWCNISRKFGTSAMSCYVLQFTLKANIKHTHILFYIVHKTEKNHQMHSLGRGGYILLGSVSV